MERFEVKMKDGEWAVYDRLTTCYDCIGWGKAACERMAKAFNEASAKIIHKEVQNGN